MLVDQSSEKKLNKTTRQLFASNAMVVVASNKTLDKAFKHVYEARKEGSEHRDIWRLSIEWKGQREEIREQLLSGSYQLSEVNIYRNKEGEYFSRWTSKDAVYNEPHKLDQKNIY